MTQVPATTNNGALDTSTTADPMVEGVRARIIMTGCYVGGSAILLQALNATSLEEATNIGTILSGKDHTDQRMKFLGVQFADSDPKLESKLPWYAICDVVIDGGTGEVQRLGCGAEHVVGVLLRAAEMGWFPFDAYLEGKDLGGGMTALNLSIAPTRVDSSFDF